MAATSKALHDVVAFSTSRNTLPAAAGSPGAPGAPGVNGTNGTPSGTSKSPLSLTAESRPHTALVATASDSRGRPLGLKAELRCSLLWRGLLCRG